MQKYVEMLEKHVQWVAIGLGALFVLFMTWTFVLHPAEVQIGPKTATAGGVDQETYDTVGKELETAMQRSEPITVTVPKYVDAFKESMDWKSAPPIALAKVWNSQILDIPMPQTPGIGPGGPGPGVGPGPSTNEALVTALPVPPAPIPSHSKFGRSVVLLPAAPGQPAPVAPPPVAAGQPAPPPTGVDKDWVTQMFKVDLGQLNEAFKASKIPPQFYTTTFLQVELQREELDADGKPVPNTLMTIPPIGVWRSATPPPPFPAEGGAREPADLYLQWASANTADIIEPLFYTWERGDPWQKPGPLPLAADVVFDPNAYLLGEIPGSLTKEQHDAVMKARQDAAKAKSDATKAARPAPRTRTPIAPRGTGAQEGSYAPAPLPPQRIPPTPRPGVAPGGAPPYRPINSDESMAGGGGTQPPANLPVAGTDFPQGEFDPSKPEWIAKVIEIWAHDDTVKPDKTYHYRARYKIKNPVFSAGNVTKPEALADTFAIASPWSEWGSNVTVPPLVNFFVFSSKSPSGNVITFDVFKFQRGQIKAEKFPVQPGDQVGNSRGGVDYKTGWTVVDFRQDPRTEDWQILLINDEGRLVTRSYKGDSADPLYKGLKDQVARDKAAEGVAVGGATGVPPPIR